MLIVLYGLTSNKSNWKYQRMIDGNATCGYREYAEKFGHIIYMSPQKISMPWEHVILEPKNILKFINSHPKANVWAVKHNLKRDRSILTKVKNKKFYYSCNSKNRTNKYCDVSFVDTPERMKGGNAKVWAKGKDPEFWKPVAKKKEFDYLLVGQRNDKNETFFLKKLNTVTDKRRVLWIGGEKHKSKIKCDHEVICTPFISKQDVRDNISRAKVGVIFTELKIEGFPQSFVEMVMCGVPVVYNINGPKNKYYFHKANSRLCTKDTLIKNAERLLYSHDPIKCRDVTMKYCSLEASYKRFFNA